MWPILTCVAWWGNRAAGDIAGGDPHTPGDGAGVVHPDQDQWDRERGRVGVDVLLSVVGPPQAHPHWDGLTPGETLGHGAGIEDPLVSRPPRCHIPTTHTRIVHVFETCERFHGSWVGTPSSPGPFTVGVISSAAIIPPPVSGAAARKGGGRRQHRLA